MTRFVKSAFIFLHGYTSSLLETMGTTSGKIISNRKAFLSIVFLILFAGVNAQGEVTLHIGDPAPELKYSKWIKGEPISSFEGSQLYILEFWATWCGPCRAAMPHLTELQKQYQGKISIIGVDIWEDTKKGKPYNSYIPIVEKFVLENDQNMGYSLVIDNNEQHMGNKWMKAAGQEGIPSTFIIRNGEIVWIGDPMALDTTLTKMFNGSYNMLAYKQEFEKKTDASQKLVDEWVNATKPIQEALKGKEYKRAIGLMNEARAAHPDLQFALDRMKFHTLLNQVSEADAIAFGKQWQQQDKNAASAILDAVSRQSNFLKTTYLWAAKTYQNNGVEQNPFSFHMLATVYANGGDFKNAVQYETKAVNTAEAALKKAKTGAMTEEILNGYKRTLKNYNAVVKENP
jgi:thiol-disulfide isomerase/thioredoxin